MTGDAVRWGVLAVVVAGTSGGLYYQYERTRPCVEPIAYAIGSVDPRFEISTERVIADAKVAENIWNTAAGKPVLVYDPQAKLKINFVYDEREAAAKLGQRIASWQSRLRLERSAIDDLQAAYLRAESSYNEAVRAYNARRGIETLSQQRAALLLQRADVDRRVAAYNRDIAAFNAEVAEYNKTAGRTFEEGQYVRDKSGERITIFQFIDATQLQRVLAHEFGHAIGLGHNEDADSIMFAKNESGNLAPTAADLLALRALCGT